MAAINFIIFKNQFVKLSSYLTNFISIKQPFLKQNVQAYCIKKTNFGKQSIFGKYVDVEVFAHFGVKPELFNGFLRNLYYEVQKQLTVKT